MITNVIPQRPMVVARFLDTHNRIELLRGELGGLITRHDPKQFFSFVELGQPLRVVEDTSSERRSIFNVPDQLTGLQLDLRMALYEYVERDLEGRVSAVQVVAGMRGERFHPSGTPQGSIAQASFRMQNCMVVRVSHPDGRVRITRKKIGTLRPDGTVTIFEADIFEGEPCRLAQQLALFQPAVGAAQEKLRHPDRIRAFYYFARNAQWRVFIEELYGDWTVKRMHEKSEREQWWNQSAGWINDPSTATITDSAQAQQTLSRVWHT